MGTVSMLLQKRYAGSLQRLPVILNHSFGVMAGLIPAIHVFLAEGSQAWMLAISAGRTPES